jgi:hypothetical protein
VRPASVVVSINVLRVKRHQASRSAPADDGQQIARAATTQSGNQLRQQAGSKGSRPGIDLDARFHGHAFEYTTLYEGRRKVHCGLHYRRSGFVRAMNAIGHRAAVGPQPPTPWQTEILASVIPASGSVGLQMSVWLELLSPVPLFWCWLPMAASLPTEPSACG